MPPNRESSGDITEGIIRTALESADLEEFQDLLDPNVRWGAPGDPQPSCQNRKQVLAWYRRGREAGVRASVGEVTRHGDKVLVGLRVTGNAPAGEGPGVADRWQVLTVKGGLVVDIRAYDDRTEAAADAGVPA
jgi:ketosteroid isomerase-like protein